MPTRTKLLGLIAVVWLSGAALDARATRVFMWRVESPSGGVGYLMGSVHMLAQEYYPLDDSIVQAFEASKTLLEEVDLNELASPDVKALTLSKAMYMDGRTIQDVVSGDTYSMVLARLQQAGLPLEPFKRMKPWMLVATLLAAEMQKASFDAELGLDRYFFDKATASGKAIQGLETTAYQIDRFDQMAPNLQEAMLRETLRDFDNQRQHVKVLADAWKTGDTATLEQILLADFKSSPDFYERLLVERNRNWVPKIEACLSDQPPCFVVVGAAHLVGPGSVVELLEAKGYRVTQQ